MARPKSLWKKPFLKVGCVSTRAGLAYLKKRPRDFDLLELRVDSLRAEGVSVERINRALQKKKSPVLLTLRTREEGGDYSWKSRERILIFKELLPMVEGIDIEMATLKYMDEVVKQARELKKGLVLSAHSIRRKLTRRKLERMIAEFQKTRANVYKIAGLGRTRKDLAVLTRTLLDYPTLPLAMMAIGEMAEVSRVVLPVFGSKLVYGYLDVPAAKNQPPIQEIAGRLGELGV